MIENSFRPHKGNYVVICGYTFFLHKSSPSFRPHKGNYVVISCVRKRSAHAGQMAGLRCKRKSAAGLVLKALQKPP